MKKTLAKISIVVGMLLTLTATVHAAYQIDDSYQPANAPFDVDKELQPGNKEGAINATIAILQIISGGLLYFAAPMAIILIGMAAFNMAMHGNETEKIEEAKKSLIWTVVGLFVIILSYSIVKVIIRFVIVAAENT